MTRYDDVPYDDHPITLSHPDRLLALGRLFGVPTASADEARVLELGCGTGANLLPVAALYPNSPCLGIDLQDAPMDVSRALARDLELTNLELQRRDLTTAHDLGEHDVVIAHGLYSWMPRESSLGLLQRIRASLAPTGVAFLSFAALPGARVRQALRDVLRARVAGLSDPSEQVEQARSLALGLASLDGPSEASRALRTLAATVGGMSDAYLFHDLLSPEYHPTLLSEVVKAAAKEGLQYVCDAHLPASFPTDARVFQELGPHAADQVQLETWLDGAHMRAFRQALFVRSDAVIDRGLSGVRLLDLTLSTEAVAHGDPDGSGSRYRAADGVVFGCADPDVVRVLDTLVGRPGSHSVRALRARPATLQALLGSVVAGQIEVGTVPRLFFGEGDAPEALPLARAQASAGRRYLTSLRHRDVEVSADARRVLKRLDGTSSCAQVDAALGFSATVALQELAAAGLLLG